MELAEQPVCWSFRAGHHVHWIQWKLARDTVTVPARLDRLDGEILVLVTEDGQTLRWWNHDRERVEAYAGPAGGRVLLYPRYHAMSIGNAWFSCDTSGTHSVCKPRGDGT